MLKEELIHFILSLIAGLTIAILFGNYWSLCIAIIVGFFLDLDHLFDYLFHNRSGSFSVKKFLSGDYFEDSGKVYVLFHGFEYVTVLFLAGLLIRAYGWFYFSLALSLLLHLLFDTVHNRPRLLTYFLVYRICQNFDLKKFEFKKCSFFYRSPRRAFLKFLSSL